HRTRSLVRVGLAARAAHALAVPARRRDGHPREARARPPALHVGTPLPPRVHGGAGAAQHAYQAPPLSVQPGGHERARADREARVPRDHEGRALPLSRPGRAGDRKSTRLNSSHDQISYAVVCSVPTRDLASFPTRRSSDLYTWGLRFLRECTAERARRNTLIKLRLCQYSQAVMNELVRTERLEYHAITKGALYLYRDPAEL